MKSTITPVCCLGGQDLPQGRQTCTSRGYLSSVSEEAEVAGNYRAEHWGGRSNQREGALETFWMAPSRPWMSFDQACEGSTAKLRQKPWERRSRWKSISEACKALGTNQISNSQTGETVQ